jgi:hypothetical protein
VDPEHIDEFENELRQAFERRPAPPSLKRRIMQQRNLRRTRRLETRIVWWQALAASLVLAGIIGGTLSWQQYEERRQGELARQQVFTALRITHHALNDMNARLASHPAKPGIE